MLELWQTEWCPASHRVREHLTVLGVDHLTRQVPVEKDARAARRDIWKIAEAGHGGGFEARPASTSSA